MTQPEFQPFMDTLESIRESLEQPLGKRDDIVIEACPDELDQIQSAASRDFAIQRIETTFLRLRQVREALLRIQEGTYGTCLGCSQGISPNRLKAVPWAEYCLACQDVQERTGELQTALLGKTA